MPTGTQLLRVVEALQEIYPEMRLNRAQTLIWVALNSGRHQLDLQNELKFSNATASRNIEWWSGIKDNKSGVSSPKFVTSYQDPSDKRYRCVELTKAGKAFMDKILSD